MTDVFAGPHQRSTSFRKLVHPLNRFSLKSLLLAMMLIAVCVAWYVEASRRPRIHYLHIYSTRYERNYVPYDGDWDRRDPKFPHNTRIATVAFLPGQSIDEVLRMRYNPEIIIRGELQINDGMVVGHLKLYLQDPGLGLVHQQTTPFELDRLHHVDGSAKGFHFAVSSDPDPFALEYRLHLVDADIDDPTG